MEELISRLIVLFGKRKVECGEGQGSQARALVAQQTHLYQTLINMFQSVSFNDQGTGSVQAPEIAREVFNSIRNILENNPPQIRQEGSSFAVRSAVPILEDDAVQAMAKFNDATAKSRSRADAIQSAMLLAAAMIVEAPEANLIASIQASGYDRERGLLQILLSRYVAERAISSRSKLIEIGIEEDIGRAKGQLENYRAEFEHQKTDQRQQLDALTAASSDIIETHKELQREIDDSRSRLTSFEKTMREELRLQHARLTWEERYKEARLGFGIACGLLLLFLIVTIGTAIMFGPDFILKLAKIEKDTTNGDPSIAIALTHQFGRLIVFSVPVIVYLWMLRAVMRFFIRSMLLMDDARQRQTMLDTYFLLSEKGRADERDRPLILWALFRQTPGHGPDGVEPPDFTEVINAGLKRGAAGE